MILWIRQLQAESNIMRRLPKRVFAHRTILEMLALGAGPPEAAGEAVEVTVDLS